MQKESVELIVYRTGGSGKPRTNKQYPTLAGIYLDEYMTQQVMNV